ncbi:hypothetical protein LR48_Vigan08g044600 [Vigna angularis]|uniref:Uncharacterized protein n=1 Tax=Phaseolus angularis TaxID=3914 RepID=A0A0L9V4I4_PHAAN|nr:hypothetical protein LR48_Vigan08g044600 [Vigna angularis]
MNEEGGVKEEKLVHQHLVVEDNEPKPGKLVKLKNKLWVVKAIKNLQSGMAPSAIRPKPVFCLPDYRALQCPCTKGAPTPFVQTDLHFSLGLVALRIPFNADTINDFLNIEWQEEDEESDYEQLLGAEIDYEAIERTLYIPRDVIIPPPQSPRIHHRPPPSRPLCDPYQMFDTQLALIDAKLKAVKRISINQAKMMRHVYASSHLGFMTPEEYASRVAWPGDQPQSTRGSGATTADTDDEDDDADDDDADEDTYMSD